MKPGFTASAGSNFIARLKPQGLDYCEDLEVYFDAHKGSGGLPSIYRKKAIAGMPDPKYYTERSDNVFSQDIDEHLGSHTQVHHHKPEAYLQLFPNPTTGTLRLRANLTENQDANVQIIDATGRVVLKQKTVISSGTVEFEIGDLADGLYLVRVFTKEIDFKEKIQLMKR